MWLIGVAIIVILFFWYGNARSKESRQRDAAAFEYVEPGGYVRWIVNFRSCCLFYRWEPDDPAPTDRNHDLEYELRRDSGGQWQMRLTDASWGRALQNAKAGAKSELPSLREAASKQLKDLGDGPEWVPIFTPLLAVIENRYQTYVEVFGIH